MTHLADRFGSGFILGLSGGGDSLALAARLARWDAPARTRITCICVDHGLRDGSAADAQWASQSAQAMGLDAHIVRLDGPKPRSRVQEWARRERHRALVLAARAHGARVILLGHTRDDQLETIAFRLARQTGLDGLAGMQALSWSPQCDADWPCLIARPLLNTPRQDLRAALREAGLNWLEDPANQSLDFARIRVRRRLAELAASGFDGSALLRIAAEAQSLRQLRDQAARDWLATADLTITDRGLMLALPAIGQISDESFNRALGWLIRAIGKGDYAPSTQALARLSAALRGPTSRTGTLGGVLCRVSGARLTLTPAPPRRGQSDQAVTSALHLRVRLHMASGAFDPVFTYLRTSAAGDGLT